jgi:hypothetical protein
MNAIFDFDVEAGRSGSDAGSQFTPQAPQVPQGATMPAEQGDGGTSVVCANGECGKDGTSSIGSRATRV